MTLRLRQRLITTILTTLTLSALASSPSLAQTPINFRSTTAAEAVKPAPAVPDAKKEYRFEEAAAHQTHPSNKTRAYWRRSESFTSVITDLVGDQLTLAFISPLSFEPHADIFILTGETLFYKDPTDKIPMKNGKQVFMEIVENEKDKPYGQRSRWVVSFFEDCGHVITFRRFH